MLYAELFRPMHRTKAALVAGARGLPEESDEARLAAHALLGYALAFRGARTAMLRHLGRPAYTQQDLNRIKALIGAMTSAAIDYPPIGD